MLRFPVPADLTSRDRWVRRAADKRPLTNDGGSASSTNPATWSTLADARASSVGVGLGFVLGDGISCIDLDHCLNDGELDPRAVEYLSGIETFYIEVSPSGDGIHAWTYLESPTGRRRFKLDNGLPVEWYSRDRYITVTGQPWVI